MQRFHHKTFADVGRLLDLKQAAGQRITVCIPTLNEAGTIGAIVRGIRVPLMERVPLVDEILVVDSASADATREIAAAEGAVVFASADIAPEAKDRPFTDEEMMQKFIDCAMEVMSGAQAEKAGALLMSLDAQDDVGAVLRALVPRD